jgi:NhaP-type Na+/H+ or K+/H+ antiporter
MQQAMWIGFADFIIILIGSCAIGYIVPCLTTLLMRRVDLRGHVVLEMSVYLLMSYVPYVLAEVCGSLYLSHVSHAVRSR